jgi:hypothetical protein
MSATSIGELGLVIAIVSAFSYVTDGSAAGSVRGIDLSVELANRCYALRMPHRCRWLPVNRSLAGHRTLWRMHSDSKPKPPAMGRFQPVNRQREDQSYTAAIFSHLQPTDEMRR